jgi:hypothetical protein
LNTVAVSDVQKRKKMERDRKITTMVAMMVSFLLTILAIPLSLLKLQYGGHDV